MKRLISWLEVLLKKIKTIFVLFIYIFLATSSSLSAKENWVIDKQLSSISFELPVLFLKNVKGVFDVIDGLVEIDVNKMKKNKAIFSVDIASIDTNYKKYEKLLLSNVFFNQKQYSKALIDTKKFSYENEQDLTIDVELTIKDYSKIIPINIKVNRLAVELIQIQGEIIFSRTDFNLGTGKWSNTLILKDNIKVNVNLFLFKE